jgi:phosphoribosylaminoimidazole-succinocarboxamide synthase
MRGYITGSTSTSLWTNYSKGVRNYCGHIFPDGLRKNQKLDGNKLTPTTKSDEHDELISAEEIIKQGYLTEEDWNQCAIYAHALFEFGQEVAKKNGLILVDTKYEFGKDADGNIVVADEIHTPDSSRYWVADTYDAKFANGEVKHIRFILYHHILEFTLLFPCRNLTILTKSFYESGMRANVILTLPRSYQRHLPI